MAKQSGLHQIRGKVGEHSYYKQSGVSAGLIRSINQGMSSRVKTAEEYANTRLNNQEFGQACRLAAQFVRYITPKFRPMILPFSQSKLSAMILESIKSTTGNWGQRNFSDTDGSKIAPMINQLAKNNFDDYGIIVSLDNVASQSFEVDAVEGAAKLAAIGADGYHISVWSTNTWIGSFSVADNKYARSYANRLNMADGDYAAGDDQELSINFPLNPPTGWPATADQCVVIVVLPFRTVNNVKHILQEYCTFKAFGGVPEV